jgi:UDP-galactopyranose mutase
MLGICRDHSHTPHGVRPWQHGRAARHCSKKAALLQGLAACLGIIDRNVRKHLAAAVPRSRPMQTLIVFSHLRWNFVYQRPQHLLSRLARHWRVVFVEEPMVAEAEQRLEKFSPAAGVEVWRPHVSATAPGFHDEHISVLQKFVADAIRAEKITDYWIWFYTPMAVPLAAELEPRGIVYDCMDELTLFKNAPRQLVQRENVLFKEADLVFTGGPSLYNSKKGRHPSCRARAWATAA